MHTTNGHQESRFVLGRYTELDNDDIAQVQSRRRKYRIVWSRLIEIIASIATILGIIYLLIRG